MSDPFAPPPGAPDSDPTGEEPAPSTETQSNQPSTPSSDPMGSEAAPVTETTPDATTSGPASDPTAGEVPNPDAASGGISAPTEPVSDPTGGEAAPTTETTPDASTSGPPSNPGGDTAYGGGTTGQSEEPPEPGSTTGEY